VTVQENMPSCQHDEGAWGLGWYERKLPTIVNCLEGNMIIGKKILDEVKSNV